MKKTTVVTALFDIGRDKWEHHGMSQDMYLWWYKNTLSLNSNHIIYTDDVYYDRIVKFLREFGMSRNVIIYKKKLEELPAYQLYYKDVSELMASPEFQPKIHFKVPEMLYPLYNIIMFNKIFFLKEAAEKNPFCSEYFIWADAGGLREDVKNYRGAIWPNEEKMDSLDKNKILVFCHHPKISILVREHHALSQMRFIQGTAFYLTPHLIQPFIELIDKNVRESVAGRYIGSDEKIFDFCYLDRPELFQLEVSSWREYFDRYK